MDTIAFLTLFLGLSLGPTDVKLSATDAVKRIELRLDGASVATLTSAPWTAHVNLGRTLVPHRLSAIAYDASGEQIASIEQKINVPRPTTEARIVVEHDRAGVPKKARVVWNSVATRKLRNVSVDLDGVPLTVAKDLSVTLPSLSKTPHILRATVVTPSGDAGEATTLIGASLAAESESQLTAVAVEVDGAQKRDTSDLLRVSGKPVRVIAVDKVSAEVIFVRHPSEKEALMKLDVDARVHRRAGSSMNVAMMTGVSEDRDTADVHLGADDSIRFLWPTVSMGTGETKAALFPSSRSVRTDDHGLRWWLSHISAPEASQHRYADAVAVAGLQALGSRRARAVVLIIDANYRDASALTPAAARAYLDQVGVPLFVWSLAEPDKMPESASAWGAIDDVSTMDKLRDATKKLSTQLAKQQIVWAEGDFLPQDVALGQSAGEGIRLLAKYSR
jgi:hypothetical protein